MLNYLNELGKLSEGSGSRSNESAILQHPQGMTYAY